MVSELNGEFENTKEFYISLVKRYVANLKKHGMPVSCHDTHCLERMKIEILKKLAYRLAKTFDKFEQLGIVNAYFRHAQVAHI